MSVTYWMRKAGQVVAQPVPGALEGEIVPRDSRLVDRDGFKAFFVARQLAADRGGAVHDNHGRAAGVRVDVDQPIETNVEAAFFTGFTYRRRGERFAAVDVAAGEDPFAVSGLDGAPHEDDLSLMRSDNRTDGDFRIEVEDKRALAAHEALGLSGFQQTRLEHAAADGTEPISMRFVRHALCAPDRSRADKYNSADMSILKVARMGHPALRAKSRVLDRGEIKGAVVQKLIDDMIDTMLEYHGVGLAAPQVHEGVRIFVASLDDGDEGSDREPLALINPEITVVEPDVVEDWEGCLSIPDIRGRVPRARAVKVRAFDRTGERIEIKARDYPARVIQHETDHLDGVLFFDRMRSFESLTFLDEYARYWTKDE